MPAVSIAQRRKMALALLVKQRKRKQSSVPSDVVAMARSMSVKQLKEFASTPEKGLPKRKRKTKRKTKRG